MLPTHCAVPGGPQSASCALYTRIVCTCTHTVQSMCLPTLQRVRSRHSQLNGTIGCMQGEGGRGGGGRKGGREGGREGGGEECGRHEGRGRERGRNGREKGGRGEGEKKSSSGEKEERGRALHSQCLGIPPGIPPPPQLTCCGFEQLLLPPALPAAAQWLSW